MNGAFPRSESGRTTAVVGPRGRVAAHVSRASRKDLRDAVTAARKALPGWSGAAAYLRGQILYRAAEMLEGRRSEFEALLASTVPGGAARARREVNAAVDRLVAFAGWADKFAQVLGCNNPVAGPYYNFTIPEPTGVVGVLAPDEEPLLALISLVAPLLTAGNAVVALGSSAHPLAAAVLGEVFATSDVPPGVVNLLTGDRSELAPFFAAHRDIDAIHAAGVPEEVGALLRSGAAENLKRVTVRNGPRPGVVRKGGAAASVDWYDTGECHSPWWIEPFVEMKTVWHPVGA
ncbi:MAG: aldehyde dehydrogenase family protein [Phycisphaerae bacterium]|nr:aldehyde dehydrogenase family protein [Phycisphaerae bacterium]